MLESQLSALCLRRQEREFRILQTKAKPTVFLSTGMLLTTPCTPPRNSVHGLKAFCCFAWRSCVKVFVVFRENLLGLFLTHSHQPHIMLSLFAAAEVASRFCRKLNTRESRKQQHFVYQLSASAAICWEWSCRLDFHSERSLFVVNANGGS